MPRPIRIAVAACFALATACAGATRPPAPEPIITDRPDFTESVETVPAGHAQLEGGITVARGADETATSVGELLLRVAAGSRAELRVGLPTYERVAVTGDAVGGLGDVSIGTKLGLFPGGSVILATSLPTGARAFRADAAEPEMKLSLGRDLSDVYSVGVNLNAIYPRVAGERHLQLGATTAFGIGLSERSGMFVEWFGFAKSGPLPASNYFDGGYTYQLTRDFQLDARAGVGANGIENDWFAGVGFARRW